MTAGSTRCSGPRRCATRRWRSARLGEPGLEIVDVGAGTGFATEGILAVAAPDARLTMVDQSTHQLRRARHKPALDGIGKIIGDAEELPFADDRFDRYVSTGSIEYWPDPQRAIAEAYRVVRPGGVALVAGPSRAPTRSPGRCRTRGCCSRPRPTTAPGWSAPASPTSAPCTSRPSGGRRAGTPMRWPSPGPSPPRAPRRSAWRHWRPSAAAVDAGAPGALRRRLPGGRRVHPDRRVLHAARAAAAYQ